MSITLSPIPFPEKVSPLCTRSLRESIFSSKSLFPNRVGNKILKVNTSSIYRGKYSGTGIIPSTTCKKVFTSSTYHGKYPRYLLLPKIIPGIFPTLCPNEITMVCVMTNSIGFHLFFLFSLSLSQRHSCQKIHLIIRMPDEKFVPCNSWNNHG